MPWLGYDGSSAAKLANLRATLGLKLLEPLKIGTDRMDWQVVQHLGQLDNLGVLVIQKAQAEVKV